ncbi:MAG: replication-associated recombination protein A [Saprospiraceae bacterium]|nr:replication-associated recombination protein A [Saprospiraceae bacterium]
MQPLAERMRPRSLDDYIGQKHLVGQNAVLRRAIESDRIPSMILWGTPGVGKTTLANIIASVTKRAFFQLSAINSGVKDVRETIEEAKRKQFFNTANPILFIDEIHRFSKSQQDSLLGAVEKGIVTLIGATTENPSFEVIPALLSRCQVYVLKELEPDDLLELVNRALKNDEVLQLKNMVFKETEALLLLSGGDARKLLNIVELISEFAPQRTGNTEGGIFEIDNQIVTNIVQQNIARYDKSGEQHYDIISAFIKSMRGSDPNAAVYYLARMLEGGEDVLFIARRMIILASEDIGLANPNALLMATTTAQAVHQIGMPEARIILSQCAIYLATSPKSNSAYMAIDAAIAKVRATGNLSVPLHLRNAPTSLMKKLDYGKGYKYAHNYAGNFVEQEFLPQEISGEKFFDPSVNAAENRVREQLRAQWKEKYGY